MVFKEDLCPVYMDGRAEKTCSCFGCPVCVDKLPESRSCEVILVDEDTVKVPEKISLIPYE